MNHNPQSSDGKHEDDSASQIPLPLSRITLPPYLTNWWSITYPRVIFNLPMFDCKYGSWGVCFTYGTWFGVKGLVAAGKSFNNSSSIKKACDFLLSKQLPSGDWGESYLSCQNKVYSNIEGNKPHMVNTGWAMLALIDDGQGAQVSMTSPGFFVYELYAPRELIPFWKSFLFAAKECLCHFAKLRKSGYSKII
ncbi:hypothetical protein HRI_001470700 [Hibiscus trionum]|uniref:Squalene cyclase C-terminal domain-containing protein n=2 Tax=Hibiscus trionum TaxID=183268 RepID=A0A9W7HI79_HIBTR|nr:hypothetical protein HRI_001470700 [Hibiscus trionum]